MKAQAPVSKSIVLFIILTLIALPVSGQKHRRAATAGAGKAVAQVEAADKLANQKKYAQAIEAYKAAISADPSYAPAYSGLGDAYMGSGNSEQALAAYQEEVRVAPNDAQAHYDLGYFYNAMGRYGEAFAPLTRAKQLNPGFTEAFYELGVAYLQTADYEKALAFFGSATRMNPNYGEAYYGTGQAYLKSGKTELAKEQLNKLSTIDGRLALKLEAEIQRGSQGIMAPSEGISTNTAAEKPAPRLIDTLQAKSQSPQPRTQAPSQAKTETAGSSNTNREPASRQLQQGPTTQTQTPTQTSSSTTQPARAQTDQIANLPASAKRWALVIGVDQYIDPQISALKGSDNDARMIADALTRYSGFPKDQVILLSTSQPVERQPTRVNILRRLANLSTTVPKDGLLLVSFAGHGMERSGQAFLLPADAQISDSISFLEETAISMTRVKAWIKETGVGQVLMLLDACRNDPGGRADAPNPLSNTYVNAFNFDVANREIQAFATVYATGIGQRAYEYTEKKQGYFSWAVVEGLKGGAANEKGEVTLAQLVKYVQEAVPKRIAVDLGSTKQQKPFAVIEGYRADELVLAVTSSATNAANNNIPNVQTVDPAAIELSFWDTIKNSNNPEDFKSYLDKYPDGQFAALAKSRANSFKPPTNYGNGESPEMVYWNAIKDSQNAADFRSYLTKFPQGLFVELANNRVRDLEAKASGRNPAGAAGLTSGPATLKDIEVAYKSNMYDETVRLTTRFLETTPDDGMAHAYMGLALLAKKDADNAVLHLERAIALGQSVNFPLKRLREPLIGHDLDNVLVHLFKDSVMVQQGNTVYRALFTDLKDSKINNYQNYQSQCPIAYLKGAFTEASTKSEKVGKPSDKGFNLFPATAILRPVQQGNMTINYAYCMDDGIIPTTIVKLIYRLSANK